MIGSGHGFKFLPRIGHYIALMLEGKLPARFSDKWKWRPGLKWDVHLIHCDKSIGHG
jgi:glycine/D-amino acid oxidase-like deaminating enzyme